MGADAFAPVRSELLKFWRLATGRDAPEGIVEFAIDPAVSRSGNDAYAIRSKEVAGVDARNAAGVAITGSNLRSVFYGLYDLLERRVGCRWFWDGDIVPRRDSIDLSGLDVREESQFEFRAIRYFAHRGLKRFQAEHWGPDDWVREIDWCMKRRLNTFMLRIGQDDLFQRAFPGVVPYPDPSKDLPDQGSGYDNRSLFWSLEYRGWLRAFVQRYGRERGMMIPEDFGTMSHWYSRTPREFLEKMKPDFVPQASSNYAEESGLVWDVRQDKWLDAYWKLTETAIRDFGQPDLLHTIGLGERKCFEDRERNFEFKKFVLGRILGKASAAHPEARLLLAGWDFYHSWNAEEVKALMPCLDPKRVLLWDYEGDAYAASNFTEWGVVGKFPYTFGIFLTLEQGLDVRADYSVIEAREKVAAADPLCKGYIFWPESSHTDSLLIEFFARNSWRAGAVSHDGLITQFCRDRYGHEAKRMEVAWRATVPISTINPDLWARNYGLHCYFLATGRNPEPKIDVLWTADFDQLFAAAPAVLRLLAGIDASEAFVQRDAIDLARTIADRLLLAEQAAAMSMFRDWRESRAEAEDVAGHLVRWRELADAMADLLSLHEDYSLWKTLLADDRIEKIRNPCFGRILIDNAMNDYCSSHQAELARHVWFPVVRDWTHVAAKHLANDDHSPIESFMLEDYPAKALATGLEKLHATLPREGRSIPVVLSRLAALAENFVSSSIT